MPESDLSQIILGIFFVVVSFVAIGWAIWLYVKSMKKRKQLLYEKFDVNLIQNLKGLRKETTKRMYADHDKEFDRRQNAIADFYGVKPEGYYKDRKCITPECTKTRSEIEEIAASEKWGDKTWVNEKGEVTQGPLLLLDDKKNLTHHHVKNVGLSNEDKLKLLMQGLTVKTEKILNEKRNKKKNMKKKKTDCMQLTL